MTVLIEVRKGDGTLVGRCDAKCYMAEHPKCTCVCGGANHGVGRKKAEENTVEHCKEIENRYAQENVSIIDQLSLF